MINGASSGICFVFLGLEHVPSRSIAEPWWGDHGEKPASKNLHPTVPKTESKIDPKHVDGYAFFHVHAVQSHKKIPKGRKFKFSSFLSEKICMFIFLDGQYFANFRSKQRVTDQ